jgi:hypothetical protein
MLRGQEKVDPGQGFSGSASQGKQQNLRQNQKMEIIKFFFEATVVMVGVCVVAALTLTSRSASSKKQEEHSWGSE